MPRSINCMLIKYTIKFIFSNSKTKDSAFRILHAGRAHLCGVRNWHYWFWCHLYTLVSLLTVFYLFIDCYVESYSITFLLMLVNMYCSWFSFSLNTNWHMASYANCKFFFLIMYILVWMVTLLLWLYLTADWLRYGKFRLSICCQHVQLNMFNRYCQSQKCIDIWIVRNCQKLYKSQVLEMCT